MNKFFVFMKKLIKTILIKLNLYDDGTTTTVIEEAVPETETPINNRKLLVGTTNGPETHDHLKVFKHLELSAINRAYYLLEKDFPKMTVPKDHIVKLIPTKEGGTVDFKGYDNYPDTVLKDETEKQYYSRVYGNFVRMKNFFEATYKGYPLMISTETIVGPDGKFRTFPNKNHYTEEWTKKTITAWVEHFIHKMNIACGIGNWIWQLSSEPWDEDWQQIQRWYVEAWLDIYPSIRPKLATAALPIGQDETFPIGSNKYFGRPLTEYVPEDLRPYFSIVCFHAYALTSRNEWTDNPEIPIAVGEQAIKFRNKYMPHCEVSCTEHNFSDTYGG